MPRTLPKQFESEPFYAVAGAGDYAAEKLRAFSKVATDRLTTLDTDAAGFSQRLQRRVERGFETVAAELPDRAQQAIDTVSADVRRLPERAQAALDDARGQAEVTYRDLIARGREAVGRYAEAADQSQKSVEPARSASSSAKPSAQKGTAKSSTAKSSTAKSSTAKSSTAKSGASKSSSTKSSSRTSGVSKSSTTSATRSSTTQENSASK